jgi:phospholipase C
VYAANGFFRRFAGSLSTTAAIVSVRSVYDDAGGIALVITNGGTTARAVTVTDQYTGSTSQQLVAPAASFTSHWTLQASRQWYDLVVKVDGDANFIRQYAGHIETGADGITDPQL